MTKVAKFLTALAGAGAQLLALGIVAEDAENVLQAVLALLTAVAVYLVPNAPADVTRPQTPGRPMPKPKTPDPALPSESGRLPKDIGSAPVALLLLVCFGVAVLAALRP